MRRCIRVLRVIGVSSYQHVLKYHVHHSLNILIGGHETARPGLRTVNSGFCIGFSEGSLKSSKTYEKYTVYNKKGTSSRIFNFSFHHFMKIFLFNLLISKDLDLHLYDLTEAPMNIEY